MWNPALILHLLFLGDPAPDRFEQLKPNSCNQNSPLSESNTWGLFTLRGFYWPWLVPENQLFRFSKIRNKKWIIYWHSIFIPNHMLQFFFKFIILHIWVLNVEFMQLSNGLVAIHGTKIIVKHVIWLKSTYNAIWIQACWNVPLICHQPVCIQYVLYTEIFLH